MTCRLAALAALALIAASCGAPATPAADKPDLYLITSLPLLFGEGFALDQPKAPVATALEAKFELKPIDLPSQVPVGATLLMAQPRALPAEELVALDAWVRRGGKLVLLADPLLEWPSERPIGDRLRPPIAFADTGLLQHWGLRLDAPEPIPADAPLPSRSVSVDGFHVVASGPGTLFVQAGTACRVGADGFLATCSIGKGRAIVVADADFINVGDGEVSPGMFDNVRWLSALLERVGRTR